MAPKPMHRLFDPFIIRKVKDIWLTLLHSPHYIRAYVHNCCVNLSEDIILIEQYSAIAINFYLSSLNSPFIDYSITMLMDPVNSSNLLAGMMLGFVS